MNTSEKSEMRDLTADEINDVSGGCEFLCLVVLVGAAVVSTGLVAIGLAEATGAVDALVAPIRLPHQK